MCRVALSMFQHATLGRSSVLCHKLYDALCDLVADDFSRREFTFDWLRGRKSIRKISQEGAEELFAIWKGAKPFMKNDIKTREQYAYVLAGVIKWVMLETWHIDPKYLKHNSDYSALENYIEEIRVAMASAIHKHPASASVENDWAARIFQNMIVKTYELDGVRIRWNRGKAIKEVQTV